MGKKFISILLAIALSVSCFLPVMAKKGYEEETKSSSVPIFGLDDFSDAMVGASEIKRAIVLVLDNSGSMREEDRKGVMAIDNLKIAAKNFCKTVLESQNDTAIGIVKFSNVDGTTTKKIIGLTQNYSKLETKINKELQASGTTDIYDGLSIAKKMLDKSTAEKKYIILMTDGVPEVDEIELRGHSYMLRDKWPYDEATLVRAFSEYDTNRIIYYNKLMNAIDNYCNKIKKSNNIIYTVGYFESYDSEQQGILKGFLEGLASTPNHFYDASRADELSKIFKNIAEDIVNPVVPTLSSSYVSSNGNLERYEIKVTVKNPNKKKTLKNVFVTLDPKDATIVKGKGTQTCGELAGQAETTFTWEVDIDKTKHTDDGTYTYLAEIGAADMNGSTEKGSIRVSKLENKIECEKVSVPWNGKETKILLKAKASGGTLTFESNTKDAVVDGKGNVTVKVGFVGKISITISTKGNERYEPASKTITLKVLPTPTKVTGIRKVGNSEFEVTWKECPQLGGYEIIVAKDMKWEEVVFEKTIKGASNTSVRFSVPENTSGFYIRIRTYKSHMKKIYYSKWNNITVGKP